MEYKISKFKWNDVILEKHMESKGFFRNVSGSSKVGEIALLDFTEKGIINYFTENDKVYYMELKCFKSPTISIGDKKNNVPAEERIKFLYEALLSNENYNRLTIMCKDSNSSRRIKLLFEIDKANVKIDDLDILAFFIMAYRSKK